MIDAIKEIIQVQMINEVTMDSRRMEIGQAGRRTNENRKNRAGFVEGLGERAVKTSLGVLFEMVGTNVEFRVKDGDNFQMDDIKDEENLDHVIELDRETTTLIRMADNKKITWRNGTSQLPFRIAMTIEQEELWDKPRHEGGLIKGDEPLESTQRVEDFKKKFREKIQKQYVEGTMFLKRTGSFIAELGDERLTWKKSDVD